MDILATDTPPPNSTEGDADRNHIFLAVGHACHRWEVVESSLAQMFVLLVESPTVAGLKAYGSVPSTNGRVEMLRQTAKAYCFNNEREPVLARVRQLLDRVRRGAGLRNKVVHGVVAHVTDSNFYRTQLCGPDEKAPAARHFLISASYNSRAVGLLMNPSYAWNSETVNTIADAFHQLAGELVEFNIRVLQGLSPSQFDTTTCFAMSSKS